MQSKKAIFWLEYVLFLTASLFLLVRPIGDMDEIWNYNFGYNICNGLLPYSEFNCIVSPLSAYISAFFLYVFGNSLYVFRVVGIVFLATSFFILFLILHTCCENRILAFTCSVFAFALCYLMWIFNYNNLNLLWILLALLLEYKIDQKGESASFIQYVLIGLVYGAIFLTKQSVGSLFVLYNVIFCLVCWRRRMTLRKYYLLRLVSSLALPLAFVVYLVLSGSFLAFWDYAIAGIGTFSHRITYFEFISSSYINLMIGLVPIIITAFSIRSIVKGASKVSRKYHISTLIISWIGLSVAYPLCDYSHMCIGIVPFTVCAFCCLGPQQFNKWQRIICAAVSVAILLCVGVTEIKATGEYKICELNNYKGLFIEKNLETQINNVGRYISEMKESGCDVLIADSYAAVYLLPIDLYYKDFSLLNRGNLGTQSVEDLLWRHNAIYLVNSDQDSLNWQTHFELIEYIRANYSKIEEVFGFDVYKSQ